ncbi:unnamed protein product [Amoebophrya sp. A25]|nr:unnamed protein product [Amoebophrya sp. A25]|eukprot:GSA25T00019512001.1
MQEIDDDGGQSNAPGEIESTRVADQSAVPLDLEDMIPEDEEDQKREILKKIEHIRAYSEDRDDEESQPPPPPDDDKDNWPLAKEWAKYFPYDSLIAEEMWSLLSPCDTLVAQLRTFQKWSTGNKGVAASTDSATPPTDQSEDVSPFFRGLEAARLAIEKAAEESQSANKLLEGMSERLKNGARLKKAEMGEKAALLARRQELEILKKKGADLTTEIAGQVVQVNGLKSQKEYAIGQMDALVAGLKEAADGIALAPVFRACQKMEKGVIVAIEAAIAKAEEARKEVQLVAAAPGLLSASVALTRNNNEKKTELRNRIKDECDDKAEKVKQETEKKRAGLAELLANSAALTRSQNELQAHLDANYGRVRVLKIDIDAKEAELERLSDELEAKNTKYYSTRKAIAEQDPVEAHPTAPATPAASFLQDGRGVDEGTGGPLVHYNTTRTGAYEQKAEGLELEVPGDHLTTTSFMQTGLEVETREGVSQSHQRLRETTTRTKRMTRLTAGPDKGEAAAKMDYTDVEWQELADRHLAAFQEKYMICKNSAKRSRIALRLNSVAEVMALHMEQLARRVGIAKELDGQLNAIAELTKEVRDASEKCAQHTKQAKADASAPLGPCPELVVSEELWSNQHLHLPTVVELGSGPNHAFSFLQSSGTTTRTHQLQTHPALDVVSPAFLASAQEVLNITTPLPSSFLHTLADAAPIKPDSTTTAINLLAQKYIDLHVETREKVKTIDAREYEDPTHANVLNMLNFLRVVRSGGAAATASARIATTLFNKVRGDLSRAAKAEEDADGDGANPPEALPEAENLDDWPLAKMKFFFTDLTDPRPIVIKWRLLDVCGLLLNRGDFFERWFWPENSKAEEPSLELNSNAQDYQSDAFMLTFHKLFQARQAVVDAHTREIVKASSANPKNRMHLPNARRCVYFWK